MQTPQLDAPKDAKLVLFFLDCPSGRRKHAAGIIKGTPDDDNRDAIRV